MTTEFRATVIHRGSEVVPLVDEYNHGTYKRSIEFIDAPEFKDMFSAYEYARREASELNRRFHNEQK